MIISSDDNFMLKGIMAYTGLAYTARYLMRCWSQINLFLSKSVDCVKKTLLSDEIPFSLVG